MGTVRRFEMPGHQAPVDCGYRMQIHNNLIRSREEILRFDLCWRTPGEVQPLTPHRRANQDSTLHTHDFNHKISEGSDAR